MAIRNLPSSRMRAGEFQLGEGLELARNGSHSTQIPSIMEEI